MTDLSWVEEIHITTSAGEVNSMIDHEWRLLHVTGGLYTATEYVLGRPRKECIMDCIYEEWGEHDQCVQAHCKDDCGTDGECGSQGHEWGGHAWNHLDEEVRFNEV